MQGTGLYLKAQLQSGKFRLLAWPLGLIALIWLESYSVDLVYGETNGRLTYIAAAQSVPITATLSGASGGLTQLGGIIANELAVMLFPYLALFGILGAIASTRLEEDTGRVELLGARPVGRLAPLSAGFLSVTASLLFGTAVCVGVLVGYGVPFVGMEPGTSGSPTGGALAYGLLLFAYGWFFSGVGFLCAELAGNARNAKIIGLAFFGASYLSRAAINGANLGVTGKNGVGLSWLTPLGWFDAVAPFAQMRLSALVLLLTSALALVVLAVFVRLRRDLGSGALQERSGRSTASRYLGTPSGLAWRLNRATVCAWVTASLALALLMGAMLPDWVTALEITAADLAALGWQANTELITNLTVLSCTLFASANGITLVGQWASEENSGRIGLLTSRPRSFQRLWISWLSWALAVTAGITAISTATYLGGAHLSFSRQDNAAAASFSGADVWLSGAVFSVPALLLVALAGLWVAWRASTPWPIWVIYTVSATFIFFAPMLDLPDWVLRLGVFNAVGNVPFENARLDGIIAEALVGVTAVILSVFLIRRRDQA